MWEIKMNLEKHVRWKKGQLLLRKIWLFAGDPVIYVKITWQFWYLHS